MHLRPTSRRELIGKKKDFSLSGGQVAAHEPHVAPTSNLLSDPQAPRSPGAHAEMGPRQRAGRTSGLHSRDERGHLLLRPREPLAGAAGNKVVEQVADGRKSASRSTGPAS